MVMESHLVAFFDLDFEKFVYGFFVVERVHDCEIDDPTEVDEVSLRAVLDAFLLRSSCTSSVFTRTL
jgi:hypothetical protein